MPTTEPFAKNGVSLRLYPHNELDAGGVLREICAQAKLGLDHGFDGIMTACVFAWEERARESSQFMLEQMVKQVHQWGPGHPETAAQR